MQGHYNGFMTSARTQGPSIFPLHTVLVHYVVHGHKMAAVSISILSTLKAGGGGSQKSVPAKFPFLIMRNKTFPESFQQTMLISQCPELYYMAIIIHKRGLRGAPGRISL